MESLSRRNTDSCYSCTNNHTTNASLGFPSRNDASTHKFRAPSPTRGVSHQYLPSQPCDDQGGGSPNGQPSPRWRVCLAELSQRRQGDPLHLLTTRDTVQSRRAEISSISSVLPEPASRPVPTLEPCRSRWQGDDDGHGNGNDINKYKHGQDVSLWV